MAFWKQLYNKPTLPDGFSIITWKNNLGEVRYSVFMGDDRLMSFSNQADALSYINLFIARLQQQDSDCLL